MITVNDKLKLFRKQIIERRQKQYDDKVEQLEKDMLVELEDRKKMLDKDRIKYEATLLKSIKSERAQRLSNARSERKRRLLLKRREMIDELLAGVKAYAKDFVETDVYEAYLVRMFEKNARVISHIGSFDLFINERDMKYKDMFESLFKRLDFNCQSIQVSDKAMLGGGMILKSDKSTRLDLTLNSVIEDNKKYMGQLIYDMLEEAGEFSE